MASQRSAGALTLRGWDRGRGNESLTWHRGPVFPEKTYAVETSPRSREVGRPHRALRRRTDGKSVQSSPRSVISVSIGLRRGGELATPRCRSHGGPCYPRRVGANVGASQVSTWRNGHNRAHIANLRIPAGEDVIEAAAGLRPGSDYGQAMRKGRCRSRFGS